MCVLFAYKLVCYLHIRFCSICCLRRIFTITPPQGGRMDLDAISGDAKFFAMEENDWGFSEP